jgi:hypothetical protein
LDPIEKAIRNAFGKGNADDRAFREKVYRSAFAALDRALQANPGITVEVAIKRRKAMQARIAEIESEFLPAVPAVAPQVENGEPTPTVEAPSVDVEPKSGATGPTKAPAIKQEPSIGGEQDASPSSAEPHSVQPVVPDIVFEPIVAGSPPASLAAAAEGGVEVSPDRDERRAARRRLPYGALLLGLLLLGAAGGGLWWATKNGLLKAPAPINGAPPVAEGGGTPSEGVQGLATPGEADKARAWITVFTPSDPTLVSAPSDAKAEVMQDDTGSFLRIRSGASGAAVSFDVGQGVLEKLAGKHAVFDILARSEEGKETQMSLDCNFGDMGDCGRKRYAVGHERNEYLFDVQFPDRQPNAAGTIAINSDFDKQGKSIDIYEIRVSVAE